MSFMIFMIVYIYCIYCIYCRLCSKLPPNTASSLYKQQNSLNNLYVITCVFMAYRRRRGKETGNGRIRKEKKRQQTVISSSQSVSLLQQPVNTVPNFCTTKKRSSATVRLSQTPCILSFLLFLNFSCLCLFS